MLENSLRTRGVVFAFLFGPPRFVQREDAARVHGRVCDQLAYDDITFQYSTSSPDAKPSSKGFAIRFERKEGRGVFQAGVEYQGASQPMRLLISHDWPPSLEHVKEIFDLTTTAVFDALEGPCQRVVAEVRLRAQCDVREQSGLEFFLQHILKPSSGQLTELGTPLAFGSIRLEVAGGTAEGSSLDRPKRDLTVEVLREDPRCVYLELVSQWTQIPSGSQSGGALDLSRVRAIDQKPSAYIEEAHRFLTTKVVHLGG